VTAPAPVPASRNVLLTGGAGFIGSHVAVELARAGHHPVILDSLVNAHASVIARIASIVGRSVAFVQGDVRDLAVLRRALVEHRIDSVVHLAGLKAVAESVQRPLEYWDNNVGGTLRLLEAMHACGVRSMVFSSSATVYGDPERLPIDESHPLRATNPYGRTKLAIERMLADVAAADPHWRLCMLRYFNPVGAHPDGLIGEHPRSTPTNLMPLVLRVASRLSARLCVWGHDYPTADGTAVRDFVHVADLARGHVAALHALDSMRCEAINLGTGRGTSVLELVRTFERVNGVQVPFELRDRRAGDVASCFADASLAERRLGWRATRTLEDMCRDAWRWQNSPTAREIGA
jgi:UDP-glucose 4-epimerase